jgi:hypothetical protein
MSLMGGNIGACLHTELVDLLPLGLHEELRSLLRRCPLARDVSAS